MKKIYNKNAREKALLEEAYANVYSNIHEVKLMGIDDEEDAELAHGNRPLSPKEKASHAEGKGPYEQIYDPWDDIDDDEDNEVEGSPNVIHDLLEKVYEISGRLHGEIEDLGIFLPREHSKRWTKLEELQKELESVVDEYGDDKFWAARQEDRKYSAEPRGGYHEW